ncbi:MAG: hypothetical protein ACC631_10900 [Halocynthiibacter sp.]
MKSNNSDINRSPPDGKPVRASRQEFSWYAFLLGPPFRLIGFFYRTYHVNRGRLAALASKQWISSGLKIATVLTLFVWIAIWLLAGDQSRNRLTDAVKENFSDLGLASED